jgi:hypothetical protein
MIASEELENEFLAISWARAWLKDHAVHDRYRLSRDDGAQAMLMIRAITGQWYAMPLPEGAATQGAAAKARSGTVGSVRLCTDDPRMVGA